MTAGVGHDLATLIRLMPSARRRQLLLVAVLMPIAALAEMVSVGAIVPFLALLAEPRQASGQAWLIDLLQLAAPESPEQMLLAAAILFAAAIILATIIRLLLSWSTQRFAYGLGHDLAVEIQRRVLLQPYSFHLARNSSQILASLDKVELLVFTVILKLCQAAAAAIISLFVIVALIQVDALSAVVAALLVLALYAMVLVAIRKRLSTSSEIIGSAYEQRLQTVQESLGGIRDVILEHSQPAYLEAFRRIDGELTRARADMAFIAAAPRYFIEVLGILIITLLALFIADREDGLVQALPVLGALALGAQRLLPLTQQIYNGWTALAGCRSVIAHVIELLQLPVCQHDDAQPRPAPFDAEIRFEGVHYSYADRQHAAVEGIDLTIPKGARVALIGRTGSGKSTLADLLMGLIEPTAGQISIDGIELTPQTARAWQRSIAHVPQTVFLADTSIARNIAFGSLDKALDMDRIERAAATAHLADFIGTLPEGYETRVGERGVRLSGGQRQRLGIARAIYRNAPVLVLDEATSALDAETEAAVLASLGALAALGRTILIIAHRRSTIASCDLVIRLENGRLAAAGSYEQMFGQRASEPLG